MNFTAGKARAVAVQQEQTLSLSYALHKGFGGKDGRKTQEILPIWEAAKMQCKWLERQEERSFNIMLQI